MKTRIKLTEPLGFCYGVKRAVNLAKGVLKDNPHKKIYSLGEIIHNRDAVKELSGQGLIVKNSLKGIKRGDILIISSHGVGPDVLKKAKDKGIKIVNATCPNVITSQRLCDRLKKEGYFIVIIGDKKHREIEALKDIAGRDSIVVKDDLEAGNKKIGKRKIGIVVQTTQSKSNLADVLAELRGRDYKELRVLNTICNDTSRRQRAALNMASKVDTMFVIGGKHSANTRRLFELCKRVGRRCYHIENDKELKANNIKKSRTIGVVSGASTPNWIIEKVINRIERSCVLNGEKR